MAKLFLLFALALAPLPSAAQSEGGPWDDFPAVIPGAVFQWDAAGGAVFWIKEGEMEVPSHSNWISFWLRGNHETDDRVKFRKSIQKVTLLCSGSYTISAFTSHMADGKIDVSEDYRSPPSRAVRPDTVMWDIMKQFCRKP